MYYKGRIYTKEDNQTTVKKELYIKTFRNLEELLTIIDQIEFIKNKEKCLNKQ